MTSNSLNFNSDDRGVATITLNRPDRHNAFDDKMISELLQCLESIDNDESIRILVLRSAGKSFSAGADLNWMRRMADYDTRQNRDDALQLAHLMEKLNGMNKPVIALVQGATYGGGVGLVACCDIVIAADNAVFCLSEVKLGLIPAVISPYVVAAIGEKAARRYFLSAETFEAHEARRLGLVHEVVEVESLDNQLQRQIDVLMQGGPLAQSAAKALIQHVSQAPIDADLINHTAESIAAIRASDEGREGLNAFLQKRKPNWRRG